MSRIFRMSRSANTGANHGAKVIGAVAASGLAMALLGACAPAKMGAAAVVGDQRISMSDLNTAVKQWEQEYARSPVPSSDLQMDTDSIPRGVLANLVQFTLVDVAAKKQGVRIGEGTLDSALASPDAAKLRSQAFILGVPSTRLRDYVRFQLAGQALAARLTPATACGGRPVDSGLGDVVCAAAKATRIDISPRYGTFGVNPTYGKPVVLDPATGKAQVNPAGQIDPRPLLATSPEGTLSRPETPAMPDQG